MDKLLKQGNFEAIYFALLTLSFCISKMGLIILLIFLGKVVRSNVYVW